MLMKNHGFLASINGIVSFAMLYRIPLPVIISYRGGMGERATWQTEGGRVTEPVLQSLGINYAMLDSRETVAHRVEEAHVLAASSLRPVALPLTRYLMWED